MLFRFARDHCARTLHVFLRTREAVAGRGSFAVMAERDDRVVIDLHGERAQRGVELDALESFIDQFRRALREFERHERSAIALKTGSPGAESRAATAFRLVRFRTGSGIATLEPVLPTVEEQLDTGDEPSPNRTLRGLVDAIESRDVPLQVLDALEGARRAVGKDGSFGVKTTSSPSSGVTRVVVDSATVAALRERQRELAEHERDLSIAGFLHLIELEDEARRVGVRTPDGVDWACTYDETLEPVVMRLLKSLVRVSGYGRRTGPASGRLNVDSIEAVPVPEQTEFFTDVPRPMNELLREQSVLAPQGLSALTDPEWGDDAEADERFLEALNLLDAR